MHKQKTPGKNGTVRQRGVRNPPMGNAFFICATKAETKKHYKKLFEESDVVSNGKSPGSGGWWRKREVRGESDVGIFENWRCVGREPGVKRRENENRGRRGKGEIDWRGSF